MDHCQALEAEPNSAYKPVQCTVTPHTIGPGRDSRLLVECHRAQKWLYVPSACRSLHLYFEFGMLQHVLQRKLQLQAGACVAFL